eukprot:291677-Prymnesium_polylepis.1
MSQGMAVSNYKADEKEATRNRKRLMALVKKAENTTCADCPHKSAPPPTIFTFNNFGTIAQTGEVTSRRSHLEIAHNSTSNRTA